MKTLEILGQIFKVSISSGANNIDCLLIQSLDDASMINGLEEDAEHVEIKNAVKSIIAYSLVQRVRRVLFLLMLL